MEQRMNQFDNDKRTKQKPNQLLDDLNSTHKQAAIKKNIDNLSQTVQETMQPVTSVSLLDREVLAKLDQEFPSLIKDTNVLSEQVKKLQTFKVIPYQERYKVANEKVALPLLRPDLDKIIRAKNKIFFLAFEKALDSTSIIDAYPHEATLFKVGVLYKLYLHDDPSPRVIEMSIALREADLPDCFKYIEKDGKSRTALWMELAKQAYDEILNDFNLDTQQRFQASYEKFKKIYLELRGPKQVNLDNIPDNDINFPEIPDRLVNEPLNCSAVSQVKPSAVREYINFIGNELATLQFLIPEHKKNSIYIPEIGGLALDTLMQACLSKQKSIKEAKATELRKRTAADKFLLNVCDIVSDAQRAMHNDKKGQMFDPHQGYVSWKAQPGNLYAEITKLYERSQKDQLFTEKCTASGPELTEKFFAMAFKKLNLCLEAKREEAQETYKVEKKQSRLFNKKRLKSIKENVQQISEKYQQRILEMHDFQKVVEKIGAEHIKIFAAEDDNKASYSVPKNFLVNANTANAALSSTPSAVRR
jgi:hypothetical protein